MAAREDMRIPLVPEHGYHIFNRGNGGHRTFFSDENYRYFLMKYAQYMKDYWDTYAYCLLPNHFHLAIRVKPAASVLAAGIWDFETADRKLVSRLEKDLPNLNLDVDALADLRNLADFVNLASHHEALRNYLAAWVVSERFRRFLLGYAKAVNKERGQTGSLFQKIFRRRLVADDDGFQTLLMYIHRNPLHHQVSPDWEAYPWSSYRSYLSALPSALPRVDVLNRFGGRQAFVATHREYADDWKMIQRYIME
jgi:REP element-mobilizing transposase RayT